MTQKIWLFPNIYDNASHTLSGSQNVLKMGFTFILIKLKRLKKLLILPNTHKCSKGLSNFIGITKKPDRSVSVYINFSFWFLVLCHSSAWDKWMKTISMNLRFLFNKVLFLNFWHLTFDEETFMWSMHTLVYQGFMKRSQTKWRFANSDQPTTNYLTLDNLLS